MLRLSAHGTVYSKDLNNLPLPCTSDTELSNQSKSLLYILNDTFPLQKFYCKTAQAKLVQVQHNTSVDKIYLSTVWHLP